MAEAQSCRKQLADAEAATARTAGGHLDLRQFCEADPGAAWAAFRSAAEQRCVPGAQGVNETLRSRAAAAFAEMQAICALLPAHVPAQAPAAAPASQPSDAAAAAPAASATPPQSTAPTETVRAAAAIGGSESASTAMGCQQIDAGAVAAAAITASLEHQKQQGQVRQDPQCQDAGGGPALSASALLQPSAENVPSQFELVVATSAAAAPVLAALAPTLPAAGATEIVPPLPEGDRRAFHAQVGAAEAEARAQLALDAARAQLVAQQAAAAAANALAQGKGTDVPVPSNDDQPLDEGDPTPPVLHRGADSSVSGQNQLAAKDDSMGGTADDTIKGKRGLEAVAAARAIAAKAKARSG